MHHRERRLLGAGLPRPRPRAQRHPEQRSSHHGRALEGVAIDLASPPFEELAHHPEAKLTLELGAASIEDRQPRPHRQLARRSQKRRLADPRRTLHHHQAPRARPHAVDDRRQTAKLSTALQQPLALKANRRGRGVAGWRRLVGHGDLGSSRRSARTAATAARLVTSSLAKIRLRCDWTVLTVRCSVAAICLLA